MKITRTFICVAAVTTVLGGCDARAPLAHAAPSTLDRFAWLRGRWVQRQSNAWTSHCWGYHDQMLIGLVEHRDAMGLGSREVLRIVADREGVELLRSGRTLRVGERQFYLDGIGAAPVVYRLGAATLGDVVFETVGGGARWIHLRRDLVSDELLVREPGQRGLRLSHVERRCAPALVDPVFVRDQSRWKGTWLVPAAKGGVAPPRRCPASPRRRALP